MPTALITGVTGQDGSYLAELLLAKGYRVFGVVRRSSTTPYERIAHILDKIEFASADLLDQHSLVDAMEAAKPDEIYSLAAQNVADVVSSYITLSKGADSGEVFNVCSGEGRTVKQIAEAVLKIGGVRAVPKSDPSLVRPVDLPMLVGDNAKLRATGWQPAFTFDDMVTDLWNHVA